MLDKEDFTRSVERIAKLLLQKDSKNKQKYNSKDNNCYNKHPSALGSVYFIPDIFFMSTWKIPRPGIIL